MKGHQHTPCIMKDTSQFFVGVCKCGVVHLSFGATTLNLSPEALVAVSETLKELSDLIKLQMKGEATPEAAVIVDNVIKGDFRNRFRSQ